MPDNDNVIDITTRNAAAHEFAETTRALDALEEALSVVDLRGWGWTRERILSLVEALEAKGFTIARKV